MGNVGIESRLRRQPRIRGNQVHELAGQPVVCCSRGPVEIPRQRRGAHLSLVKQADHQHPSQEAVQHPGSSRPFRGHKLEHIGQPEDAGRDHKSDDGRRIVPAFGVHPRVLTKCIYSIDWTAQRQHVGGQQRQEANIGQQSAQVGHVLRQREPVGEEMRMPRHIAQDLTQAVAQVRVPYQEGGVAQAVKVRHDHLHGYHEPGSGANQGQRSDPPLALHHGHVQPQHKDEQRDVLLSHQSQESEHKVGAIPALLGIVKGEQEKRR